MNSTRTLRRLGTETFGERLARARLASGLGLKGAARLISDHVMPISVASVSRLEDFPAPPVDLRRRILATLVVLAYGFDPEDFELSVDDLPRNFDVEAFVAVAVQRALEVRGQPPSSAWLTEGDAA